MLLMMSGFTLARVAPPTRQHGRIFLINLTAGASGCPMERSFLLRIDDLVSSTIEQGKISETL
jgi:hypothetical protein